MKVELPDQKQVNSNRAITESTQSDYAASYTNTIMKHNHPSHSHHIKINEPNQPNYIAGYTTSTHDSNEPYITSYGNKPSHEVNEPYITAYGNKPSQDANEPYITAYGNKPSHEVNEPYITAYRNKPSQDANEPYITGYRNKPSHDSSEPYITGYKNKPSQEANEEPYITGYKNKPSHDSSEPYITGYSNKPSQDANEEPYITGYINKPSQDANDEPYITGYKNKPSHDSSEPYITGYRNKHSQDANDEPYITAYGNKPSQNANEPYITAYGNKPIQDSTKPYVTQYGHYTKKDSTTQDASEAYITQYGDIGHKKDSKKSTAQDSGEPYITHYGGIGPKTSPKHDKEGYIGYRAAYRNKSKNGDVAKHIFLNRKSGRDLEDSKGMPPSKVDHTEAFKTGFFALDDLFVGNTMTLKFPVQEISPFLPRKEADSIPFSMSQLPSVLELFSISQDSSQAKSMRGTLDQCEGETITGETKICATSLESMLEFVDTIIGSETKHNILTTSHPTTSGIPMQKYTILKVQDINAPKWVACHPLPYPYAVYYCHFIATGSKVFKVSLGGENGAKIEALGICHLDTSDWNPDHIIFKQLGFNPGKNAPVCHFFPVRHLMWVPQLSNASM
ncbi:hypothetical protein RIF29_13089 [Crotalaria pallida]|uniref:BURP domain-containing protein n=1 Tax=Crotalaria pallida TaxID=3830 RepID=A0AAN9P1U9_CROPI